MTSRPAPRFELAIIGCGAAAVCFLDGLLEAKVAAGRITMYDSSPDLWRGRAYQQDTHALRLNSVPDDMSISGSDPGHFTRWLAARDVVCGPSADAFDAYPGSRFVPRAVYGDYLEYAARDSLMRLIAVGWDIELVHERVTGATRPASGKTELLTHGGRRYTADYVVLCVGRGGSPDEYGLTGSPQFIADPYPADCSLDGVDPDASVGVIGSGLTAVDVALALRERGHRGPVTLLSRHGILPSVRQKPINYTLRYFTPEHFAHAARHGTVTLDTIVQLLRKELDHAGEDLSVVRREIAGLSAEPPVQRLRRQLAEVDSKSIALRVMQTAVPGTGPRVWPLLARDEKIQLLRGYYRSILALCCPMPPSTAAKILEMTDAGQLRLSAGIQKISRHNSGYLARTEHDALYCDTVINAVNAPAHKIPASAASLVESLVAEGIASYNPAGGVEVHPETSQLVSKGRVQPQFFALGDLTFGTFFFTFGIPAMVDRARDICHALQRHTRAPITASSARPDFALEGSNRSVNSSSVEEVT